MYIKDDTFVAICIEKDLDAKAIATELRKLYPDYTTRPYRIEERIKNLRRKGLLPLPSGNSVSTSEVLKGTSTLYDEEGNVKLQWVKSDVPKQEFLDAFNLAIEELSESIPKLPTIEAPTLKPTPQDLATVYISNDVHFGALMWGEESGKDWDTDIASQTLREAYDYLFSTTPDSPVGIVVDLGE